MNLWAFSSCIIPCIISCIILYVTGTEQDSTGPIRLPTNQPPSILQHWKRTLANVETNAGQTHRFPHHAWVVMKYHTSMACAGMRTKCKTIRRKTIIVLKQTSSVQIASTNNRNKHQTKHGYTSPSSSPSSSSSSTTTHSSTRIYRTQIYLSIHQSYRTPCIGDTYALSNLPIASMTF